MKLNKFNEVYIARGDRNVFRNREKSFKVKIKTIIKSIQNLNYKTGFLSITEVIKLFIQ